MFVAALADAHRWRRQADESPKKDDSLEQELCKDKDAGEWFRLVAGEGDNCRDVIQCTASVTASLGARTPMTLHTILPYCHIITYVSLYIHNSLANCNKLYLIYQSLVSNSSVSSFVIVTHVGTIPYRIILLYSYLRNHLRSVN